MKKLTTITLLLLLLITPSVALARGVSRGSRSGSFSGSRSYSGTTRTTATTPTRTYTAPTPTKTTATTPTKTTTLPSGRTVTNTYTPPTTPTKTSSIGTKTIAGKTQTGYTTGAGFQPKLSGGYVPPVGSVVYYPQTSILDYLPLYYILSHGSHQTVTVQEPNSTTTKQVKEEGTDSMYVINWIITIIVGGLIIWGIMALVNKYTKKDE